MIITHDRCNFLYPVSRGPGLPGSVKCLHRNMDYTKMITTILFLIDSATLPHTHREGGKVAIHKRR